MSCPADSTFLVIGSDGLLGRQLFRHLTEAGKSVWGTSRREDTGTSNVILLNLGESAPRLYLPQPIHVSFVCAAVTSMTACEEDPVATRRVNVTNTLRIAEQLLGEGSFLQFLSTNAVFDGAISHPGEQTPTCATTEYGRQKAEVEARLLELDNGRGLVGISRMSKVLAPSVPVIRGFLEGLTQQRQIEAISDLMLSPISLNYTVSALLAVARKRLAGIFHFSGEEALSYADLSRALARRLGVPASLVMPVDTCDRGVAPVFRPAHPALGMARTRQVVAISPQPLEDVITELLPMVRAGPNP